MYVTLGWIWMNIAHFKRCLLFILCSGCSTELHGKIFYSWFIDFERLFLGDRKKWVIGFCSCLGACGGGVMGQHHHLMTSMLTLLCDNVTWYDKRCVNSFWNINTHLEYEWKESHSVWSLSRFQMKETLKYSVSLGVYLIIDFIWVQCKTACLLINNHMLPQKIKPVNECSQQYVTMHPSCYPVTGGHENILFFYQSCCRCQFWTRSRVLLWRINIL